MEYALDPYRHPGRIMASRLLGFPCRRGLNPPSFGDRCDRIGNKTRDRSGCVVLRAISKETSAADYRKRYYHSIALLYGSNLDPQSSMALIFGESTFRRGAKRTVIL